MNIFAIVVIIISTFSAAFLIINKEIKHCKNIDIVILMINDIKSKSLYYAKPFSEIIQELHESNNYEKFVLTDIFCKTILHINSVPDAWRLAVEKSSEYFSSDECDVLMRFGEEMCRCNREEISGISDNVICEFQQFRQIAAERRNIKSKSTAAVTVSAGLMIVLVLA